MTWRVLQSTAAPCNKWGTFLRSGMGRIGPNGSGLARCRGFPSCTHLEPDVVFLLPDVEFPLTADAPSVQN